MANKQRILTVAKVIIAAAWADGQLTHEEVNSLKEMLLWLPSGQLRDLELNQREWTILEMYIDSPVSAAEREQLVQQLQAALRSPKDRELVRAALQKIIHADGTATAAEKAAVADIESALAEVNLGAIGRLGRLVRQSIDDNALAREQYLDDFIKNKVYYSLQRRIDQGEAELDLPEEALRKLSLAGALMARVAHVDREVTEAELSQMVTALEQNWQLEPAAANFVARVAVSEIKPSEDYFRLVSEFGNTTTIDERAGFVEVLFAVAAADGGISFAETEEIRTIANILLLPHQRFIEAKLKVTRNQ